LVNILNIIMINNMLDNIDPKLPSERPKLIPTSREQTQETSSPISTLPHLHPDLSGPHLSNPFFYSSNCATR
jgi:hypothetical protein